MQPTCCNGDAASTASGVSMTTGETFRLQGPLQERVEVGGEYQPHVAVRTQARDRAVRLGGQLQPLLAFLLVRLEVALQQRPAFVPRRRQLVHNLVVVARATEAFAVPRPRVVYVLPLRRSQLANQVESYLPARRHTGGSRDSGAQ